MEPINDDKCQVQLQSTKSDLYETNNESKVLQTYAHQVQFMPFHVDAKPATPISPNQDDTHRAKRSISLERTIEIMVVTDFSMWKYHGESLNDYVFSLIASVSSLLLYFYLFYV